jgi:hypothetical protein
VAVVLMAKVEVTVMMVMHRVDGNGDSDVGNA